MQILDSLVDGALRLRNRRDGDELLGMMVRFLATGEEPEPRNDVQEAIIASVMPVLEKSRARAASGSSGGKTRAKPQANGQANAQANRQANDEANDEANAQASAEPKPQANVQANTQANRQANGQGNKEEELGRGAKGGKEGSGARFRAPSPAEAGEYAAAYCEGHEPPIDPALFDAESFVDFYASKGWRVGNAPMKDWKAAARRWIRRRIDERKEAKADETPVFREW